MGGPNMKVSAILDWFYRQSTGTKVIIASLGLLAVVGLALNSANHQDAEKARVAVAQGSVEQSAALQKALEEAVPYVVNLPSLQKHRPQIPGDLDRLGAYIGGDYTARLDHRPGGGAILYVPISSNGGT